MFVLLKGATKEQSFKIGQEIAEAVTATNPKPVKLKFEKVRQVRKGIFALKIVLLLIFSCNISKHFNFIIISLCLYLLD